jgi:hypothetical protein
MPARWKSPKSTEAMDQIMSEAQKLVIKMDHDSFEFETMLVELAEFAGCFNHHITRQQRLDIIEFLSSLGNEAIDPVLEALVRTPRVEQFDVTRAFINKLRSPDQ